MAKLGFDTSQKICRYYRSSTKTKNSKKNKNEQIECSNIRKRKNRKIENTISTKLAKGYIRILIRHAYLHRQAGSKNAPQFLKETGNMDCHCGSQNA
jgi:hypothetical protein